MKKKLAKLLALGMSIALVFSLAACGGNADDETTTSDPAAIDTVDGEDPSAVPESSEEAPSDNESQPETAAEQTGITNPGSDVAKAVSLYNAGVSQSGFSTAKVNLKWGGSDAGLLGDLNGPKLGNGGVATEFEKPRTYSVKPGSIRANDISKVSSTDNGDSITMTFTLKGATGDASSAHGDFSYPYFITFSDASGLVSEIGNGTFGLDIVLQEKNATLTIEGGSLTATIDKATGKMTALSCSITKETVKGKATLSAVPVGVTATIWGSGSITFA